MAADQQSQETKLADIRRAMEIGDWERAIKIAGKFQRLGEHGDTIKSARDALNNRQFYEQMGKDVDQMVGQAIDALKERYSKSWQAVNESTETIKGDPDAEM